MQDMSMVQPGRGPRVRGLVLAILFFPAVATAGDDLAVAQKQFDDLAFEKALRMVERVLKSPISDPQRLQAAYRLKGLSQSVATWMAKVMMVPSQSSRAQGLGYIDLIAKVDESVTLHVLCRPLRLRFVQLHSDIRSFCRRGL